MDYLNILDNKFNIKDKAIININQALDSYYQFKDKNWHASYFVTELLDDVKGKCNINEHEKLEATKAPLSFNLKTFNESQELCNEVYENAPLVLYALDQDDIGKKNSITSVLFSNPIFGYKNLDSIVIRMPTEAD